MADTGGLTAEDLIGQTKARTGEVSFLADQDLASEHEALQKRWTEALQEDDRHNRNPEAPKVVAEIRELEERMESAMVVFKMRSIGRRAWQDLMLRHPPSKETKKTSPNAEFDPQRFPSAAVAASTTEIVFGDRSLTDADEIRRYVNHLADNASVGVFEHLLFPKCVDVNVGGAAVPKLPIPGRFLQASEQSGTTPVSEASLDPSFSDE